MRKPLIYTDESYVTDVGAHESSGSCSTPATTAAVGSAYPQQSPPLPSPVCRRCGLAVLPDPRSENAIIYCSWDCALD